MEVTSMGSLPGGVVVVAVLGIVHGLGSLLLGLLFSIFGGVGWLAGLLGPGAVQEWGGGMVVGGLTSVLTGLLQVIAGFGLLSRQGWAWILAVIGAGLGLVAPVLGLLSGHFWTLLGLLVPAVVLWYLLTPEVRRAFGRAPAGDAPAV
jgi:hypothetical protein